MGENRQTYHHSAPRPCSRVQRMDGDKPLSGGLNPRDKLSINSHLGICQYENTQWMIICLVAQFVYSMRNP